MSSTTPAPWWGACGCWADTAATAGCCWRGARRVRARGTGSPRSTATSSSPCPTSNSWGPTETPGQFYVAAKPKKPEDGATIAIRILDFKTRETGPAIAQNPKYDMRGMVQDRDGKLLGGCYFADVWRCDYTDKAEAQAREALGALIPADHDLVVLDRSDDGVRWLVSVSAPNEPGRGVRGGRGGGGAGPGAGRGPRAPGGARGRM